MSRIKSFVAKSIGTLSLTLALVASNFAGAATAIADDTAYTLTTVERGTLLTKAQAKASIYYPEWASIDFTSDYGSATFVKFVVESGAYVEKGQVIAEIRTEVDDIAMEELNLQLKRAQEDYEEFLTQMESALQAAEAAVGAALSENEKKVAELELEKQRTEYMKRKVSAETGVLALEKRKQIYEAAEETTEVVAPVSGVIGWLNRYRNGDTIWDGASLGGIYDTSKTLFTVKDMTGVFRYGMSVTLKDSQGNEHVGEVISCSSDSISQYLLQETAYIRIENPDPMLSYTAAYETIRMENVLLVSASAVKTDAGGTYVLTLSDGRPMKQYFVSAKIVNGTCYVLSGLTEGMQVIIN